MNVGTNLSTVELPLIPTTEIAPGGKIVVNGTSQQSNAIVHVTGALVAGRICRSDFKLLGLEKRLSIDVVSSHLSRRVSHKSCVKAISKAKPMHVLKTKAIATETAFNVLWAMASWG